MFLKQTSRCGEVWFGILAQTQFWCLKANFQIPPVCSVMFVLNHDCIASRPHLSGSRKFWVSFCGIWLKFWSFEALIRVESGVKVKTCTESLWFENLKLRYWKYLESKSDKEIPSPSSGLASFKFSPPPLCREGLGAPATASVAWESLPLYRESFWRRLFNKEQCDSKLANIANWVVMRLETM